MKRFCALALPALALIPLATAACGSDTSAAFTGTGAGATTSATSGGGGAGASGGGAQVSSGSGSGTGGAGGSASTTTSTGATSGGGGSMGEVADPGHDGAYQTTTLDDQTQSGIPIHAVYPVSGPTAGPYPVVLLAHGFQLPATQYYNYAERLATFGYVALTVDFTANFLGMDNTANAADLIAGLDWASSKLAGTANADLAGVTGHSLGGKLALLAATMDSRFKASIVLDPVDGGGGPGGGCMAPKCVDVSALMPSLQIPTGFVGETTDASGGFQPCAPAAENFQTFYAATNAPSLAVTVVGANHMSFLDDVASCGLTCSFCNAATASNATVNDLARAYVVAFYERHLRGDAGYDTYLTGAKAQELYVTPGLVTIASK